MPSEKSFLICGNDETWVIRECMFGDWVKLVESKDYKQMNREVDCLRVKYPDVFFDLKKEKQNTSE